MGAYIVPTRGQSTASREMTKWNIIQIGGYNVPTRGQRTASREMIKRSRIQTRICSPTLNTERHGILIAQIWIKNQIIFRIIVIIKYWSKRKHSGTAEPAKWRGRWIIDKQRCAYTDQWERNPLVWLYKTTSNWDHPAASQHSLIHLMHD
jgi:hypothetical protein